MKKVISMIFTSYLLFFMVLTNVFTCYANGDSEEFLYKFEKINKEGEVFYNKDFPITIDGKQVKLGKNYNSTKEMFRGTWIATISNINFPQRRGESFEELTSEFNLILDRVQEMNLNAIFFQVSPELDAFYKSKLRPWSTYLTGEQGKSPDYFNEGKDFLDYAIRETRRRGIEFHAWFNPYRVTKEAHLGKTKEEIIETLSENNFARKNKDAVYLFGGKLFLDPGRDEVINFIKDSVYEFITNYDVDGIHFDDYFYPYGSQNLNGKFYKFGDLKEDLETFKNNSRGITDIKDWRRDNVNTLVKQIKFIISHYNYINQKCVQWGISPFGIYAHKGEEIKDGIKTGNFSNGSNTPYGSLSSYRDIYADTLNWIDNDLIDYVIPQVYWTFGKKDAPYEELIKFWSDSVKNKRCHLYIGHGNYNIRETKLDKAWDNPYEITNQIKFNSKYENIYGSSFFSVKDLYKSLDVEGLRKVVYEKYIDSFENTILKNKSLVPPKPWLDFKTTSEVIDPKVLIGDNSHYLFFKDKISNDSKFYVVYGFKDQNEIDLSSGKNILGVYGRDEGREFQSIEFKNLNEDIKVFVISVKDLCGNETQGIKCVFKI